MQKRITISVSQEDFDKWEAIMFDEKYRSFSAFVRDCLNRYIEEKKNYAGN